MATRHLTMKIEKEIKELKDDQERFRRFSETICMPSVLCVKKPVTISANIFVSILKTL